MKNSFMPFALVVLMAVIMFASPNLSTAQFYSEEFQVTSSAAIETTPAVCEDSIGQYLVYTSRATNPDGTISDGDIYYQRFDDKGNIGEPVQITSDSTDDQLNDCSGDFIVYSAYVSTTSTVGTIMRYQISTGQSLALNNALAINEPRISGDNVVWRQGAAGATEVHLFNLTWPDGADSLTIAGPSPPAYGVAVGDRFVAWAEYSIYQPNIYGQYNISAYDLENEVYIKVTDTPDTHERRPATTGAWIFWKAQDYGSRISRIEGLNLDTGEQRIVADGNVTNRWPSASGDYIAYESDLKDSYDINIYKISTGETAQITNDPIDQYLNDVGDGAVAYVDRRNGSDDIFLSHFDMGPLQIKNVFAFIEYIGPNSVKSVSDARVLALGTQIFDPWGVPDNIVSVKAISQKDSAFDRDLPFNDHRLFDGLYQIPFTDAIYTNETGQWDIVVENMHGETTSFLTHNLDKPRDIPLTTNITTSDTQIQTPTISWDPVFYDHDLDGATPKIEVDRYRLRLIHPFGSEIFKSDLLTETTYKIPSGALHMYEHAYVRIEARHYDPDEGALENRSSTFSGYLINHTYIPTRVPPGDDVEVIPVPTVGITFDKVTAGGEVEVVAVVVPQIPAANVLPKASYDISTTAEFEGSVTVCLGYGEEEVESNQTSQIRLLHLSAQVWEDITTTTNQIDKTVCGETNSLSPFVLAIVEDKEPPTVEVSIDPAVLWPPNHKMVPIAVSLTAADKIDPSPSVQLMEITMNEGEATNTFDPEYDYSLEAGHTLDDIKVDADGTIWLRAERAGRGDGRVYTLKYRATDASGNSNTASATVMVPHSQ